MMLMKPSPNVLIAVKLQCRHHGRCLAIGFNVNITNLPWWLSST